MGSGLSTAGPAGQEAEGEGRGSSCGTVFTPGCLLLLGSRTPRCGVAAGLLLSDGWCDCLCPVAVLSAAFYMTSFETRVLFLT